MTYFGNTSTDFVNTGFKIHIPVIDDARDPLVKDITAYLDERFGNIERSKEKGGTYRANIAGKCGNVYKVGSGGDFCDGSGMTVYGTTSSQQEMNEIAKEIEEKFGKRIAEHRKVHGITLRDSDFCLTPNVTARFDAERYHITEIDPNGSKSTIFRYSDYDIVRNPSHAPVAKSYIADTGRFAEAPMTRNGLSKTNYNLLTGESTLRAIDDFGEFFTGPIQNGKIPQHILDGLPKEFLDLHPDLIKELPLRVEKGTTKIVAHMLCDVAKNGANSPLLKSNEPWFTTLDQSTIKKAKELLRKIEPETADKLEKMLPDLIKKTPKLSMLQNPTSKTLSWVDNVYAKFKTPQVTQVTKPTTLPAGNKQQCLAKRILDSLNSKGGKVGLCIAGAAVLTAGAVSIFNQDKNDTLLAGNHKTAKKENLYTTSAFKNSGNLAV